MSEMFFLFPRFYFFLGGGGVEKRGVRRILQALVYYRSLCDT